MGRFFNGVLLAGMLLPVSAARAEQPLSLGAGFELRLNVRVYDYANVAPAAIERARTVASQVFENAGVGTEWFPAHRLALPESMLRRAERQLARWTSFCESFPPHPPDS